MSDRNATYTADAFYKEALRTVINSGGVVAPRGRETLEVIGAHLCLKDPLRGAISIPERGLNYHFMLAEWLWIMLGMNDVEMILPYNKQLLQFSDNGSTFNGAYGPKLIEQLPYAIDVLRKDRHSRQAIVTLWRERPRASADIPCTISFQFLLRERESQLQLDMVTYMRSNDVWLGLPYDLFTFTMLQRLMAAQFDAKVGHYHHMVGSLHLYKEHLPMAMEVLESDRGVAPLVTTARLGREIPSDFRAMFTSLTLMARHAEAMDELQGWVEMMNHLPAPWGDFLNVLAHKFHKNDERLPQPWKTLIQFSRAYTQARSSQRATPAPGNGMGATGGGHPSNTRPTGP